VVWYRLTSSANTMDMISAVFPFPPSYPIKRGLRKAHWPHSLEPNTSAHEALIGFYQELAMHNGHVGMANPITSQSRDPTPLTHKKKRATEFYVSDSTTPDTSALNPHDPARTFGSDVSTKGAHGVHLVLDLDLESIGLRSPKQIGLRLGLGLPGPNQIGLPLGLGLPGPNQIGLLLGLELPGPRPDRNPPWTRAPGLLGLWVWRAGSATFQPAIGVGKSNLPHGTKTQGT
jgi:hypothetical protein